MSERERVNILLVDDQPAKLLSYEAILRGLGENIMQATSATQALDCLLKNEIAVVLVDVCMPDLDGYELAAMIRQHPRYQKTSIIFVSAILMTELDRLRGYECGAVDYVPVPVVPEILRAKVSVFADLYRKTRQLERLNRELEQRVAERTAALEASTSELRDKQERLRLAVDAGRMGTWEWDVRSGAVSWDSSQYHLYALAPGEELAADSFFGMVLPDDLPGLKEAVARTIERGAPYKHEFRIRQPDGAVRWLTGRGDIVRGPDGRPEKLIGVSFDITEHKRSETALREREEELRRRFAELEAVYRTAPVGLAFLSADLRFVRINERLAAISGLPVEAHLGRTLREVLPGLADVLEPLYRRLIDAGEPVLDLEVRGTTPAEPGVARDWLASYYPVKDAAGGVLGVNAVVQEITERKRAEAAQRFLSEASALLAASLEPEAVLAQVTRLAVPTLADWCFVDLLEGGQTTRRLALAHADPGKAQLAEAFRRVAPDPNGPHPTPTVLRTGQAQCIADMGASCLLAWARDAEHLGLLRELAPRSWLCVPLGARGRTLGTLTFVTAESGRRYGPADLALAEELARRAALAIDNARLYHEVQTAVSVRDEFLARASHELRTPLTILKGNLALLTKPTSADRPGTELIATCRRHVARMERLVGDLLDLARLEAGQGRSQTEPLEPAALVEDVLAQLRPLAQAKGLELRSHVEAGLRLVGDAAQLEQVLINLVSNAVRHTPAGGTISMDGAARDGAVELRVRDSGEGITPDYLERIFEPFFQAGSATGRRKAAGEGTGLGLAIVRRLVELHGGRIWAESEGPGRGSTFIIRLPAAASNSRAA
jgi:PAS domain S-box-containing protein